MGENSSHFKPGNKLWQVRSQHGRGVLFSSPELMWEACCEYFDFVDRNPFLEEHWVGKNSKEVYKRHPKPYTYSGLCLYLDVSRTYFNDFRNSHRGLEPDFSDVLKRIDEVMYTQKFEGAASGLFNANIIARDLGLVDRTESKNENTNTETVNVTLNL